MDYKSNRTAINYALKEAKHEFCVGVGTLCVAEVQSITPVLTGNLKRSIASEAMDGDIGVTIGVTDSAPYGIDVEKGIGQPAQPYLEPGAMNAIPKIPAVARSIYRKRVGGK